MKRNDNRAPPLVILRVLLGQSRRNAVHLGLRLLQIDARLQSSDHGRMMLAANRLLLVGPSHGLPGLRPFRISETSRRNADNRIFLAVKTDFSPDNIRVASELRFPERIAQDQHLPAPALIFVGSKRPADDRLRPEHAKKSVSHPRDAHHLRLTAAGHSPMSEAVHRQTVERLRLSSPLNEVRHRDREGRHPRKAFRRRSMPNPHQPLRLRKRQRPQKHPVNDTKDGSIGPNAKPKHKDRNNRKPRIPANQPKPKPQLLQQISHARASLSPALQVPRSSPR